MYLGNFEVGRPTDMLIEDEDPRITPDIAFYCQIIRERLECYNHLQKC